LGAPIAGILLFQGIFDASTAPEQGIISEFRADERTGTARLP